MSETWEERREREREGFKGLAGLTVKSVAVNEDQSIMVFETDEGAIAYETYGDCCSETWFADLIGYDRLIDRKITSVEAIDLPEPHDARTRQEYDTAYGVKFTTDRGYAELVYRNSSNGYYGGEAYRMREFPVGVKFTPITDDWSA